MQQQRQIRQHEPLRVPDGWNGQSRMLVIQIERILNDIYIQLGNMDKRIKALEEAAEEE